MNVALSYMRNAVYEFNNIINPLCKMGYGPVSERSQPYHTRPNLSSAPPPPDILVLLAMSKFYDGT